MNNGNQPVSVSDLLAVIGELEMIRRKQQKEIEHLRRALRDYDKTPVEQVQQATTEQKEG